MPNQPQYFTNRTLTDSRFLRIRYPTPRGGALNAIRPEAAFLSKAAWRITKKVALPSLYAFTHSDVCV
jgi:hypothetical protein